MKQNMRLVGVVSIMSLSLVLASCGTQSDPRSKYNVPSVPKHDQPTDVKQQFADSGLFRIQDSGVKMVFEEGKTSTYTMKVSTVLSKADYRLTASNLPDGAKFGAVSGEEGVYQLTWTPAIGTLPDGQSQDVFTFSIDVVVDAKSTNADSEKLREISGPGFKTVTIELNKKGDTPSFQSVTLASSDVVAGQPVAITVVAKAPGIPADATLALLVEDSDWSSNEIVVIKAKTAVSFQAPSREGDVFTFVGLLETKDLAVPKTKKPVQARFALQLENKAMDRKSTVEIVKLNLLPAPAPEPSPSPEPTAAPLPQPQTGTAPSPSPSPSPAPKKKATTTTKKKTTTKKATTKTTKKSGTKTATTAKKKETK